MKRTTLVEFLSAVRKTRPAEARVGGHESGPLAMLINILFENGTWRHPHSGGDSSSAEFLIGWRFATPRWGGGMLADTINACDAAPKDAIRACDAALDDQSAARAGRA